MSEQGERIYTEHSPAVKNLAAELESTWNRVRSALLDRPGYKAGKRYEKDWIRAALNIIGKDIDPELFIRSHLNTPQDAARSQPNWLGTDKAVARYRKFVSSTAKVDRDYYISQVNYIKDLRKFGRSWQQIEAGRYRISALVMWVAMHTNDFPELAAKYVDRAKQELKLMPQAYEVFGEVLGDLKRAD